MNWHAVPPSTGLNLTPATLSLPNSNGSVYWRRNSVDLIPRRCLSRMMSYGVSMMSMFLQQALKQSMPLWQRNWMTVSPDSWLGTTGLTGKGDSSISLLSEHKEITQ